MFGGAILVQGNYPRDEQKDLAETLQVLSEVFINECRTVGIGRGETPFTKPSNLLVVVDHGELHIVFDDISVGGMPSHTYMDRRDLGEIIPLNEIINVSVAELGFQKPIGISLPASILSVNKETKKQQLTPRVKHFCEQILQKLRADRIKLPESFMHLNRFFPQFLQDHPHVDRNVFLMMRFKKGDQYDLIHDTLCQEMKKHELNILRADDKDYTGALWDNVCLYMFGSKYGVAVFEEIDERRFNPSVALEIGFMLASQKRCLILKDSRMPKMPTDIIGKLYKEFDTYKIEESIAECVEAWIHDIGLR